MQNRCRHDIMYTILYHTRSGSKITRLMSKVNLSYSQLKETLEYLQEGLMLDYHNQEKIYRATDSGKRFIAQYEQIKEILPGLEDESMLLGIF